MFFTGLRISLLPGLFINQLCVGVCWKWWNDFLKDCSQWCCINADFVTAVVETFLTNWIILYSEFKCSMLRDFSVNWMLESPRNSVISSTMKLEAYLWFTQILMHFPSQKIIVNTIDFTDLVFLATSVHVIPPTPTLYCWSFNSLDFKVVVKEKPYCNFWMSFAVTAIVLPWLLMSEGFLVKHLCHYSRLKYLQENTSALRQSVHWVCSFHASVKVMEVLQVALRAERSFSWPDNFPILNLVGFSQYDFPGVSVFIST